jgi:hypothetical protein
MRRPRCTPRGDRAHGLLLVGLMLLLLGLGARDSEVRRAMASPAVGAMPWLGSAGCHRPSTSSTRRMWRRTSLPSEGSTLTSASHLTRSLRPIPPTAEMVRQLIATSLLLIAAAGTWERSIAQAPRPVVYVMPIDGTGALIALATETIVMAGGGTIGAATPVVSGGKQPQVADESQCPMCERSSARRPNGGGAHRHIASHSRNAFGRRSDLR